MDNICSKLDEQINKIANTPFENKKFKVKLKKEHPRKITITSKPKVNYIKLNKKDINKIKKNTLGKELIKFRKKLYRNFKSENLNLLNNNIKTLKIKIKYIAPETLLSKFTSGEYKLKVNKIKLINSFKDKSLNHELFHMATSFYIKKLKLGFCGFQQINYLKNDAIGRGLNEGYTELLTKRYFNKQIEYKSYSYEICTFFAAKLEEIVGREQMEKFYINADLYGLYMYLLNFDNGSNIVTFIATLDYILVKVLFSNSKNYEDVFQLIECYLAKWYINKKKIELNNNIITEERFEQEITDYINSLGNEALYLDNYVKQKEYCLK